MSNHQGGPVILTASYAPLTAERYAMQNLELRNSAGNSVVWLAKPDGTATGWIGPGETKQYFGVSPSDIYVKGGVGEVVHWDGAGSLVTEFN